MEKEKITGEELIELIKTDNTFQNKTVIKNKTITFDLLTIHSLKKRIYFRFCIFEGDDLIFKNSVDNSLGLECIDFLTCTLNCNLMIDIQKKLRFFRLSNIKFCTTCFLSIDGNINSIRLQNINLLNKGELNINNNKNSNVISLYHLNNFDSISIENTGNNYLHMSSSFFDKFELNNLVSKEGVFINNNTPKSFNHFNNTEFINGFKFEYNIVKELTIKESSFNNITSFQNTITQKVNFKGVNFKGYTFFDDFKIDDLSICNRTTIRTIKQELQKTENRIDYDKFRGYELEKYKDELKKTEKWFHGDLLILQLNSFFSDHGTNWAKALKMTFVFSFLFYTCLYICKFHDNQFCYACIHESINHFTSGYFKFFLITNFYDPLATERGKFIETFAEWIPFIFGKIIIGYGLFETVQSFRKYKK